MNFFVIIFYVMIIVIFINAKRVAQSGNNHKKSHSVPNVPKSGKMVIPNVPRKKKSERTFMEPHTEEKIQPRIRTNNL